MTLSTVFLITVLLFEHLNTLHASHSWSAGRPATETQAVLLVAGTSGSQRSTSGSIAESNTPLHASHQSAAVVPPAYSSRQCYHSRTVRGPPVHCRWHATQWQVGGLRLGISLYSYSFRIFLLLTLAITPNPNPNPRLFTG